MFTMAVGQGDDVDPSEAIATAIDQCRATLGGLEGNPFSKLTLHDVVINGADRRPALTLKRQTVAVGK